MDKQFCFDALAEEGFQPEIDEDGDISFLAGEISLSLILDEGDKDFFALVCAFEVDDMDQLELLYSAASEASREYRIAKAYIGEIEDECFEIRFCVEGLATPELFRSNLRRYVEPLLDMHASVFDACEEDDSDAESPFRPFGTFRQGPAPAALSFMCPVKKCLPFLGIRTTRLSLTLQTRSNDARVIARPGRSSRRRG